jgi:ribosomal protein S17E
LWHSINWGSTKGACFCTRLTNDFHVNKRIIDDIAVIQTKRLRNKIAGFTTHLMKRIEKGPVRGISLRLQEEVSVRPRYARGACQSCLLISKTFLIIIGKREKDGLHPREVRDPNREDRCPQRQDPQADDQGPRPQEAHPRPPEGQPESWRRPPQKTRVSSFAPLSPCSPDWLKSLTSSFHLWPNSIATIFSFKLALSLLSSEGCSFALSNKISLAVSIISKHPNNSLSFRDFLSIIHYTNSSMIFQMFVKIEERNCLKL